MLTELTPEWLKTVGGQKTRGVAPLRFQWVRTTVETVMERVAGLQGKWSSLHLLWRRRDRRATGQESGHRRLRLRRGTEVQARVTKEGEFTY